MVVAEGQCYSESHSFAN